MSRIKKLESHYKKQLEEKDIKDTSFFIQSILNADITKGKYARFLIEAFLNDKFLEEDLIGELNSIVGQAISLFDKHKSKLPLEHRSIYALNPETGKMLYQSPGDLWNSVKQYQGELSGKELKREEQEKIYRETEFIYKDENTGFQIVSPLTKKSAQWWGKGTRWCTSAEKNNQFEYYNKKAPLLILLMPDKQKLQLWNNDKIENNGNEIQFMDEADNTVSLDYIKENWNILEPVCLWLNDLRFIPEHLRTEEICKLAVKQNGRALDYVPYELRTKELYELAVQENGLNLFYVPENYKTKELCEIAVKNNGEALRYIPKQLRMKELCEIAVKRNGWSLQYIPLELRTKELYELAIQQKGEALYYVPEELRTKELCELAVKQNSLALRYISEHLRTEELCKLAVQQNGKALLYAPEHLKTKELCELAVKQNGIALDYIPEKYKTKELYELAVQENGLNLFYVPERYKTPELCKFAVQQNRRALVDVPYQYRDKLKQYNLEEIILEISMEKYHETFQEIKTLFPKKDISLSYHSR